MLPGRLQARRASHKAAPQQLPSASRPDLSRPQSLDAGALSLAGDVALPAQQIVFQEYEDAVKEAQARIKGLQQTLEGWSREGETRGLMALRGVDTLTAVTTLAELGDLTRFDSPRQLMAFVSVWSQRAFQRQVPSAGGDHQDGLTATLLTTSHTQYVSLEPPIFQL